ncbi:MAG: hypothetical protein N2512_00885 [Armatimonadetes bacterium]|nr:hypothetical protein [Armatimonadota bacterium]
MLRAVSRLLAGLGLAFACGCVRLPQEDALPPLPPPPRDGYVVIGPLLPLHPLWPEARRLHEKALVLLERPDQPITSGYSDPLWKTPLTEIPRLTQPVRPGPLELTPAVPRPGEIPTMPGYQDRIDEALRWRQEMIEAKYEKRLREHRAAEETSLAKLEIELWQRVQVALNNLRIREAMGGPEGSRAREQREAIESRVERQMQAAREEAEQRLALLAEELEQAKAKEMAAAEDELRAESQSEVPEQMAAGADALAELERALELQWWLPPEPKASLPPELTRIAGELAHREKRVRQEQQAKLVAVRRAQAKRLRDQADELQRLIREDVEAAVRALGLSDGVVLRVLPLDSPAGRNMTGEYARKLRALWPQP